MGSETRARIALKIQKPAPKSGLFLELCRRSPNLPHTFACSTIGPARLNFRVRDGNGWDPRSMVTGKLRRLGGVYASCRNPERTSQRTSTPWNLVGAWRAFSPAAESCQRAISPGQTKQQTGATRKPDYQSAIAAEFTTKSIGLLQGLLNVCGNTAQS